MDSFFTNLNVLQKILNTPLNVWPFSRPYMIRFIHTICKKSSFNSIEWKSLEYSDEGEADAHMLFLLHHDLVRMHYDDNGFRIYESKGKTDIGDLIYNYG